VKPYYEHGGITIYHGDCREVLPQLPPDSIDVCVTSPPYNVGLDYLGYQDSLPEHQFRAFNASWLAHLWPLVKVGSRFYCVLGDKMVWWFREMAEGLGWNFGQMLVWCKPNFSGGTSRMAGDWNNMAEWILLFRNGDRTPMQNGEGNTHNWFVIPSPQSTWNDEPKEHPAQWPIELAQRIISRTPGEIVLDPFCGSGSGLIAGKNLGRRAIGIEIEEKYCEIAAKRLSQEVFDFSEKP
jgi:site-specific DNA-methyltransferase (adenine-specific)